MRLFDSERWPNPVVAHPTYYHHGLSRTSEGELRRRHDLVRAKLREMGCDVLISQGWFPTATLGHHSSLTWLAGDNSYRNTTTMLLPVDGELVIASGVKRCCGPLYRDPFSGATDLGKHLRGVKRVAYDGTGYLTCGFRDYLESVCPKVEIVDFSDALKRFKSVKSAEEIALIRDAVVIQDHIFASVANFIYPGRNNAEISADIRRAVHLLGADPSLMYKVLMGVGKNAPFPDEEPAASWAGTTFWNDRHYRLRPDDFVLLLLEGPGSGGYHAMSMRRVYLGKPHKDHVAAFRDAVDQMRYTVSLMRPGLTSSELHAKVNAYKAERGFDLWSYAAQPENGELTHGTELGVFEGIGLNVVDQPQQFWAWADRPLEEGNVAVTYHGSKIKRGSYYSSVTSTVVVTADGAEALGSTPYELIVL